MIASWKWILLITIHLDAVILLAFFMENQSRGKKIPYGENSTREARNGCCYSLHAEMDAIRHLPPLKLRGRKQVINLLVIRIDRVGNLKNSAPCAKCLEHMEQVNRLTSYKINNICYSDANGNIVIKKYGDIINQEIKHVSYRFRNYSHVNSSHN